MSLQLLQHPSFRFVQTQAKDYLNLFKNKDPSVCSILRNHLKFSRLTDDQLFSENIGLQDIQYALAVEYGFKSWKELKENIQKRLPMIKNKIAPLQSIMDIGSLNSYEIQRGLKDIDTRTIVVALIGLPEKIKQIFFANVSTRTAEMIQEDITYKRNIGEPDRIQAREKVVAIFNGLIESGEIHSDMNEAFSGGKQSSVDNDDNFIMDLQKTLSEKPLYERDTKEMIPVLKQLAAIGRFDGLLSFQNILDKIDDNFLVEGLQHVVDGIAPDIIEQILTAKKDSLVANYERKLSMVIAAIKGIQAADHPRIVEAKCRAFLPE